MPALKWSERLQSYRKDRYREKGRRKDKRRQDERRARGVCPRCGRARDDPARVQCSDCRWGQVLAQDRWKARQRRISA